MARILQDKLIGTQFIAKNCRVSVVRDFLILKGISRLPQDPLKIRKQIKDFYRSKNQNLLENNGNRLISEKYSRKDFGWIQ